MTTKTKVILGIIFIGLLIATFFIGRSQGKKSCKKEIAVPTDKQVMDAKNDPMFNPLGRTAQASTAIVEQAEVIDLNK